MRIGCLSVKEEVFCKNEALFDDSACGCAYHCLSAVPSWAVWRECQPNEECDRGAESCAAGVIAGQSGSAIADAQYLTDGKIETYWSSGQKENAYVELQFPEAVTFNTVVLRELTASVKSFALQTYENGKWVDFFKSDRIETYRFCTFDPVTTQRVRLVVHEQAGTFRLQEMEIYNIAPKELDEPLRIAAYKRIDFNKSWKSQTRYMR